MKNAFGIALSPAVNLENQPMLEGDGIAFWKDEQGWCGALRVYDFSIRETMGSASPEACYRSLRGRARNLAIALGKLGVKA